ncbi:hypothetical protein B0H14DRAFT_2725211 [Mycena olivaceomarginata]|nr:hypothetical protein B0H14DRAFT_2725211 [Mycena olivaceomarginata]
MSPTLGLRSWSPDTQINKHDAARKRVTLGLIIPGLGLTMVLLALCGYAAWNPVSRRYLDRVSFRLLIYTQVANLVYCIVWILGPGPSRRILTMLMFSAGMFFCMAINLPWAYSHLCSPCVFTLTPCQISTGAQRQRPEDGKYYVVGTTLLCLICNIAPYASGHLGWDVMDDICWYRITNTGDWLPWLIGTQIVWIMLFAVGEVAAFLIHRWLETRRFLYDTDSQLKGIIPVPSTIRMFLKYHPARRSLPLVSCLIHLSTHRSHLLTKLNWRIDVTILALCAGRPLIYGLLAATDPSFIRALRALSHPEDESATQSATQSRALWQSTQYLSTDVQTSIDVVCQL